MRRRINALVYRGNRASGGAVALARELGVRANRRQGSRVNYARVNTLINWGCTQSPSGSQHVLNDPQAVAAWCNKLRALEIMHANDVPTLVYTTSQDTAQGWCGSDLTVVARTLLNASSGRGIELYHEGDNVAPAPLYTAYFKGRDEYRVHFVRGAEGEGEGSVIIIATQQKRLRREEGRETSQQHFYIRSHDNGFVFCRENVNLPDVVRQAAVRAAQCSRLHFGAVDVKYSPTRDEAAVLEINTAPGLEGTTLQDYAAAFRNVFDVL